MGACLGNLVCRKVQSLSPLFSPSRRTTRDWDQLLSAFAQLLRLVHETVFLTWKALENLESLIMESRASPKQEICSKIASAVSISKVSLLELKVKG
jgi:hypothetical protein